MLLIPAWVYVNYRTAKGKESGRQFRTGRLEDLKIIKKIHSSEDIPLVNIAKKIIPRKANFGPCDNESLRIAYYFWMFSKVMSAPFIVVWYDKEGLYMTVSGFGQDSYSLWKRYNMNPTECTMSILRKCLGDWLDHLTHSDMFLNYCKNHRNELL